MGGQLELDGLRVLLVSYFFPPLASAGGHRTGALARHLSEQGASVTVITVKHGLDSYDPALSSRLPSSVRVIRVASLEAGALRRRARERFKHQATASTSSGLGRDGHLPRAEASRVGSALVGVTWILSAARVIQPWGLRRWIYARNVTRAIREQIARDRPDVVLTSLGPMSQSWAALRGAAGTGVPVAFDFRDLWTTSPEYHTSARAYRVGRPAFAIDRRLERRVLGRADYFVVNHEHMARRLLSLQPDAEGRYVVIPNGYEDDSFAEIDAARAARAPHAGLAEPGHAVIRSVGTTYTFTTGALLQAARRLPAAVIARLSIELIGAYYDLPIDVTREDGAPLVVVRPPIEHAAALRAMDDADVLLFLLRDTPGIDDMIPARLYEYLRLGKPILAVAPDGAAKELVERHRGTVIHPDDTDGLAAALTAISRGEFPRGADPASPEVARFSRRAQALTLGRALQGLAEASRRR